MTAGTRGSAEKAQTELKRRGHEVPTWTPEPAVGEAEAEADEPEHQAEIEIEAETMPEPEANPETTGDREPQAEPEAAEPGLV